MKTRSKSYVLDTDQASGGDGRLNTAQSLFYIRRLWSKLPQKLKECCIYIDPEWIVKYEKQIHDQKKVVKWITELDFFDKKYAFFPMCLWNHWVLVVVCNPGGLFENYKEQSSVIILDSLDGPLTKDFEKVTKSLMFQLYEDKYETTNCSNRITILNPKVPKQDDGTKCGFFVLYYMTLFLKDCPDSFDTTSGYPYFMTKNWFSMKSLDMFRKDLLTIFKRIDDFNLPIRTGFLVQGFDNDQDTLRVIGFCFDQKDSNQTIHKISSKNERKRERVESSEEINEESIDMTELENFEQDNCTSTNGHKKLRMKLNAKKFDEVMESLTPAQKQWVADTGFEPLLKFKMSSYPVILGFSLVSNFNPKKCSLNVNGKEYIITENDVHNILGLPRGPRKVEFLADKHFKKLWRSQFVRKKYHVRINLKEVVKKVCHSKALDRNFKLNFLCLIDIMLMKHPDNSFVRQRFIGFSGNLDDLKRYNWCEYLISTLKNSHAVWLRNKNTRFYTGSLPFLVYFFLDLVVPVNCFKERCNPRYMDWSIYSLKKIEAYLLENDVFHGDKIGTVKIDDDIVKSWKLENENENEESIFSDEDTNCENISGSQDSKMNNVSEESLYSDEDTSFTNVYEVKDSRLKGKKKMKTVQGKFENQTVDEQTLVAVLTKKMDEYDVIQNTVLKHLRFAKQNNQLNHTITDLKDNFLKKNMAANWAAEEIFGSPGAQIYIDKLNQSLQSKYAKTGHCPALGPK